jgi:hypothetical protein
MSTLYIAGDSYASIANNQTIGDSWSELLAKTLDAELVNVARPAASNYSIAIQIEWITDRIQPNDYVAIFLTDCYRELLPSQTIPISDTSRPLIERYSVHPLQRSYDGITYSNSEELISASFTASPPSDKEYREFYKKWFDPELACFKNRMVITGALSLLAAKTTKYVVCAGGFETLSDNKAITREQLNLSPENFCEVTRAWLRNASAPVRYINHIDESTHIQLANLLCKKIKNMC